MATESRTCAVRSSMAVIYLSCFKYALGPAFRGHRFQSARVLIGTHPTPPLQSVREAPPAQSKTGRQASPPPSCTSPPAATKHRHPPVTPLSCFTPHFQYRLCNEASILTLCLISIQIKAKAPNALMCFIRYACFIWSITGRGKHCNVI